jgi:hypothetical protein
MNSIKLLGLVFGIYVAVNGAAVWGDEATGTISDTGFGSFKLDEKGTIRQFSLVRGKSQYEPASWSPTDGDKVTVTYSVKQNKRGITVLAVQKTKLEKAGPNTITDLTSPVTATITETGTTGIKVKLPKGQILKFDYKRGRVEKVPAGMVDAIGDKVTITFHTERNRWSSNVNFVADKVEKVK